METFGGIIVTCIFFLCASLVVVGANALLDEDWKRLRDFECTKQERVGDKLPEEYKCIQWSKNDE